MRAPMNAVRDKKVCSRASREARTVSRIVGGITEKKRFYSAHMVIPLRPSAQTTLMIKILWRLVPARAILFLIMPSSPDTPSTIPITVFTGFLGAGKTSIILSLLPQLPKDYRVVLLKNEFGDIEGHSQVLKL
jgi:hypothetical protein